MIRVGRAGQGKNESMGPYLLFEVSNTEDGIVDLDRLAWGYFGHGLL